eukprot:7691273-Alexandrium_andersonii.AAC.1
MRRRAPESSGSIQRDSDGSGEHPESSREHPESSGELQRARRYCCVGRQGCSNNAAINGVALMVNVCLNKEEPNEIFPTGAL